MLIELIDFDDLDEHKEIIEGLVLSQGIQTQLKDAKDQTDEIDYEVWAFQVLHCDLLSFRYDHSLSNDAGIQGEDDVQEQQGDEEAVEVVVQPIPQKLVMEALHEYGK